MKTETPQKIYLKDYAPSPFLVNETHLTIRLDPQKTHVNAKYTLVRNEQIKGRSWPLVLSGVSLTLENVSINGKDLSDTDYTLTDKTLTIDQPPADSFVLEVASTCDPASNTALSGLYRPKDLYCTQCEPEGFRRICYSIDRPDVLSTYTVRIEGHKKTEPVLLSNGNLIESGDLSKGRHFAVWHDPFPKPSYLFALVAGNLACVEDSFKTKSKRNVSLRIYVEHGKEDRTVWAMESLKKSMAWDEKRFGLEYDLDIFMIVAVPDFNMGAMENKGLNIFNDSLILARPDTATDSDYYNIEAVVAHEYFHNWTGNRVTCRDWFQLCLKEGLTVFRDQEFSADMRSAVVERIKNVRSLKAMQFPEDAGPLAHPVRPASFVEINNFYTTTVYDKGAEVCRMLQNVLGQQGFRRGLDLYFERHDGQAVTVEDFVSAMADANKTDLSAFMTWYNQAGTPKLDVRFVYSETNKTARLTLTQAYPPLNDELKRKPVPIPVAFGLVGPNGKDIPLKINGKLLKNEVLTLATRKEVFTFENVTARPVPSILRGFSAPVSLNAAISDRDMLTLLRSDSDLFNRWQTAQAFALKHLVALTEAARKGEALKPDTRFISALGDVASDDNLEHEYRATFLALPSEFTIAHEVRVNVDPEAIHTARNAFRAAVGRRLRKTLENIYEKSAPTEPYSPDADSSGRRSLRNIALSLLVAGGSRFALAKVKEQAQHGTNMTDVMAALQTLSLNADNAYDTALKRFERRWKNEPLVMNKWFSLQVTAPSPQTLDRLNELVNHPLFSIKNPNRVRSVYGAFAHGNQVRFNDASGKGYEVTANAVIELDSINPQIASRLCSAFEMWGMMEEGRKTHAKKALKRILNKKGLSNDVYEIANKITGSEND